MKVRHLSGRFVRALWPGPPAAVDLDWVESVLTPPGFVQFRRQPRHDQRHAIAVARDVQARLAGTEYAGDPRWLAAALLHDLGKLDSQLGVYGRVVATVSGDDRRTRPRRGVVDLAGLHPAGRPLPAPRRAGGRPHPHRGRAGGGGTLVDGPPRSGPLGRAPDPGARDRGARRRRQRLIGLGPTLTCIQRRGTVS